MIDYYNPRCSTRLTLIYDIPSARIAGLAYPVAHDLRLDTWRCPCPATVLECRHIREAKQHECERWWSSLLADYTPEMLISMIADREAVVRVGLGDMDDEAALAAAKTLLAEKATVAA